MIRTHKVFRKNVGYSIRLFSHLNLFRKYWTSNNPFQDYVLSILTAVKNKLGFAPTTTETQPETLLRPYILSWRSKMEDPQFIQWANDLFYQWTNSSNPDTENS